MATPVKESLLEIQNSFYLGNYQAVINETSSVSVNPEGDNDELVYLYRAYIAQGNTQIVLDSISNSAPPELAVVRILASQISGDENAATQLKTLLSDSIKANNKYVQILAGIIFANDNNFEEALRCVHSCPTLEAQALTIQLYLKMDRLDLAKKEFKTMKESEDDATLTQLCGAWIHLVESGEHSLQDAAYTFQELIDKYGSNNYLLNSLAVANLGQLKFEEGERSLLECLEKGGSRGDLSVLINLLVSSQHLGKPQEVINRYLSQIKSLSGTSSNANSWYADYQRMEESFTRNAAQFKI